MPTKLIDPQGNPRDIEDGQVSAALASGWRNPTPEDAASASTKAADEQDFGGVAGSAKAAGFGALRGLSAGVSDAFLRTLGVPSRDITGLQDAHPVISTGSELVGAIAPALVAPESLLGRAASAAPASAVSAIGRAVVEHASREGAGLLERAAVHSLSAATEGAIYGGGQYVSEVALGNQPLSVEGFVGSMGKGALFSAPIGGAFTLGEGALIRARSLFPRNEVTAAAAGGVKQEASSALTSAVGDGDQMASKVRQQIELNDAHNGMAQSGQDITRRMFGDADPTLVTSQAAIGADTSKLRDAFQAYQSSRAQLLDWMHNEGDLEASLEKLTPGGVQNRDFVPQGEFGPPGKGGFKSQGELAKLAGGGDDAAVAAPTQPAVQDATRAGRPGSASGTPVGALPKDFEAIPLADLKAEVEAAEQAGSSNAGELDKIFRRRKSVEDNINFHLIPIDDLRKVHSDAVNEYLNFKDQSSPEFDRLQNRVDNIGEALKRRRDLEGGPDQSKVLAVNELGVGREGALELKRTDGGKFTSPDGGTWAVRDSGNKLKVWTDHVSNRLTRALGGDAIETRIGYIDGLPHLFARDAAEVAGEVGGRSGSAVSSAETNPLINAWAKDVMAPHAAGEAGSGIGDAMRDVLSGATQEEAVRYIEGLSAAASSSKAKIDSIIDASGLGAAAKAQAKARAESHIAWLLAHRADLVKSAAGAVSGSTPSDRPSAGRDGDSTRVLTSPAAELRGSASSSPASISRDDDLEALLRGTKDKLDQGASLRAIGDASPSKADYIADKLERRASQAEEFRARALEGRGKATASEFGFPEHASKVEDIVPTDSVTTKVGTHDDLAARAKSLASSPPDTDNPFVEIPGTKVDPAIKMRMRIAEREGGIDKALGETIVDHGMRDRVQRLTDDEAIGKLLGQRVGKDVNMGAGLSRAAKAIGDFEAASADLADVLGADAPHGAAERARAYRGATANQADAAGASAARAAEGLQGLSGPGAHNTTVDDEIDRALRKHDAAQARKAAQAAQTKSIAQKSSAPPPATAAALIPGAADKAGSSGIGGILGKATKAGVALEVLKALGVHVPALSAIPVIGPLLGLFLKAKAVLGIIGRKGGSVDSTIEGVIARRAAGVQDRVTAATAKLLETGAKVAGKASEASAGPAAVLAHKLFPGGKDSKSKDPVELYHARMDELTRALAPGAVDQAIGDRIQTADPRLKDAVAAQYQRAMQFLYSKAPHDVVLPGMLPGDGKWQPSKAQLNEWAKYVHYVGDPASVIEDLSKGVVTLEGAETLRTVYPELYSLAQQTLIKAAPEMQKTLPYTKRIAMSIMFGVPIDSTLTSSHMAFLQNGSAGGGAGPAPAAAAAPHPGAPGLTGPINLGQQTLTALDRRAGG